MAAVEEVMEEETVVVVFKVAVEEEFVSVAVVDIKVKVAQLI